MAADTKSPQGALSQLLPPSWKTCVTAWLAEDTPSFDFAGFVVGDGPRIATLWGKSAGVIAGRPFFDEVFAQCGCTVEWHAEEGTELDLSANGGKMRVATVRGPVRGILLGERVAFWHPYIRELDRQRGRSQLAVESPLLWSKTELEYLTGSPTKAEVLERAEGIKREYNELDTVWFMAGSLFQQYPYDIPTEAFPFEIFKQAFVAVQSCVVHLQNVSLARRFALVPLGPPLLAYRSNCKAMLTAVEDAVQLVVDRPYKAGESIVVWCGPQPNSRLLLNYGFVDDDNPYDRLVVKASLNNEDPQYQDKRMVAQRNGKLTVQLFHVHAGKEKEAVLDMLPYLRLGYVSDASEMQSVISSQGPICPVSPCMERAVLDQLVNYFKDRLSGYPTSLCEDEVLLADCNLDPKKRVATQIVRVEKKILTACLQITIELINQLPDHSVSPCPAPYAPLLK